MSVLQQVEPSHNITQWNKIGNSIRKFLGNQDVFCSLYVVCMIHFWKIKLPSLLLKEVLLILWNFKREWLIWDHCVSLTFARNGWVGKFLPFTRMYSNFFISASLLRLKVGKSQKRFFLLSILPKKWTKKFA